jgi:hypothetical protein
MIIFRDVPHSVPRIELLHHCQKFLDHPILLSSSYVIRLHVLPDAFPHFREMLGGAKLHFSPEIFDDLMLLTRESVHNGLITRLVPQRDFPRGGGNVHKLLQELDRSARGTTIEAEFQSIREDFGNV